VTIFQKNFQHSLLKIKHPQFTCHSERHCRQFTWWQVTRKHKYFNKVFFFVYCKCSATLLQRFVIEQEGNFLHQINVKIALNINFHFVKRSSREINSLIYWKNSIAQLVLSNLQEIYVKMKLIITDVTLDLKIILKHLTLNMLAKY
jgi:hypothetical protein